MRFHDLPLAGVEQARFKQDTIGNADFPDIVQWGEQKHMLHVFVIEAVFWRKLFCDDSGVARHAFQVGTLSKRIGFPAAVDKGFKLIRLRIVDCHRHPVYKLKALVKRVVQDLQLFRERSVMIKGFKRVLMIRQMKLDECDLHLTTICIARVFWLFGFTLSHPISHFIYR